MSEALAVLNRQCLQIFEAIQEQLEQLKSLLLAFLSQVYSREVKLLQQLAIFD